MPFDNSNIQKKNINLKNPQISLGAVVAAYALGYSQQRKNTT
jgi:hypothetical protein